MSSVQGSRELCFLGPQKYTQRGGSAPHYPTASKARADFPVRPGPQASPQVLRLPDSAVCIHAPPPPPRATQWLAVLGSNPDRHRQAPRPWLQ